MSERVPGSIEAREGAGRLVREELECGVERLVAIGQRNDAVMICLMALSVAATLTAGASAKKSHSNSTNAEATHSRPSLAPARNVLGVLAKQYSLDAQVCPGRCGHVHARRRLAVATEVTRISCAFTAASRKPCAAREHQSLNLQGYGFEHAIARMARNVLYRAS